jgi:hypothetical protein
VTPEDFRRVALGLPDTIESQHMDHPDFRVKGKIFATLNSPRPGWGMVKLPPEEQERLVEGDPEVFVPAKGAWGKQGCTHILLEAVGKAALRSAIVAAWRHVGGGV